jgi:hypothetical protein
VPITCQVVTKTYYVHVIGPLRAYYVTHVTRYLKPSSNGLYYVHVIELVREEVQLRGKWVLHGSSEGLWYRKEGGARCNL